MFVRFIIERVCRSPKLKARNLVHISAITIAFMGASAIAQNTLEFIDPLEETRTKIEKTQSSADSAEPRQKPAPPAASSSQQNNTPAAALKRLESGEKSAPGFVDKIRKAMGDVAGQFGLSTSGLLGFLGLLFAGLIALVGWTLFRGKRRVPSRRDDAIYGDGIGSNRRRQLGEKPPVTEAKQVDDEDDGIFEESMPQGFDDIYREENEEMPAFGKRAQKTEPPQSNDPGTWKKPSLERLRNSIRTDWASSKAKKKADAAATADAAAAADAEWNVENDDAPETSFFDPKNVPTEASSHDPADMPMTDVADGWDDWDNNAGPEDDVWGEPARVTPPPAASATTDKRNDALRRVRALRDSLKAS